MAVVAELAEHKFIRGTFFIKGAKQFWFRLFPAHIRVAEEIGDKVDAKFIGAWHVVVGRFLDQRHFVVIPPTAESILRQNHRRPAPNINRLELREIARDIFRIADLGHVIEHVEQRMIQWERAHG